MIRHSISRALVLATTFGIPMACSATSSETEDIAGNTVRVITADDTTRLGPDRRLLLDLMLGSYRIDVAAGPVDLTYIDVVGSDGLVRPIEEVVTAHVSSGRVTLEGLLEGFLITETENDIVFVLNGIELVDEPSGTHSTWWRSPTARCSGNNKLFGLGSSQPSNGSILFRGLIPINAYDVLAFSAQSAAQEDLLGTTDNWMMTTYGICGIEPAGLVLAHTLSSPSSAQTRSWTVSCPAGTKVLGGGGTITYANGRAKIDEIRPNETLDQVTVTASEDQDGTPSNWYLHAYAICATPPPGLVRVAAVATNGWDGRGVVARCPSEKRLLSVGGGVAASNPIAMRVFNMVPSGDLSTATVRVTTKGSAAGVTGEVRSFAICADG